MVLQMDVAKTLQLRHMPCTHNMVTGSTPKGPGRSCFPPQNLELQGLLGSQLWHCEPLWGEGGCPSSRQP